jgi:hypothetical protein
MKQVRLVLWVQSLYILITAIWPILDIESFMLVTGPKTDTWLVKTVGALLLPIGLTLGSYLFIHTDIRPAMLLGSTTALAFAIIDFYYALNDVISDIYLLDGILEIAFLLFWIYVLVLRPAGASERQEKDYS